MTNGPLERLLGDDGLDPGCEASFEALEQYAEAALRGEDLATKYPDIVRHLRNCAACREDTEGLLSALRNLQPPPDPR